MSVKQLTGCLASTTTLNPEKLAGIGPTHCLNSGEMSTRKWRPAVSAKTETLMAPRGALIKAQRFFATL